MHCNVPPTVLLEMLIIFRVYVYLCIFITTGIRQFFFYIVRRLNGKENMCLFSEEIIQVEESQTRPLN